MKTNQDLINIIKNLKTNSFEIYQNKAIVFSVFRALSPLSKQFIIRLLKMKQRIFSKQNLLQIWFYDINSFKKSEDELIEFKIIKTNGDQLEIDDKFIKKIQKLVINGYTCNLMERSVPKNENLDKILKEESVSNWRKIHETLVGGKENSIKESSNLYKVLLKSELIKKNNFSSNITEKGFHFILNCTSDQINNFLYDYCTITLKENQYYFIFELNLCHPKETYAFLHKDGTSFNEFEKTMINDFKEIGLIWSPPNRNDVFQVTPLFWNCSFEKEQKDLEFMADIIVETNFKLYAYSVSNFIQNLLEHFCEIKYKLPNLLIGSITRESVLKAFKKNISADQLIEFLNKNINPEKIRLMSENSTKKVLTRVSDDEKRKPLEYLRLYNKELKHLDKNKKEKNDNLSIPDNVIQQLKLWEMEKDFEYNRDTIKEAQNLDF